MPSNKAKMTLFFHINNIHRALVIFLNDTCTVSVWQEDEQDKKYSTMDMY